MNDLLIHILNEADTPYKDIFKPATSKEIETERGPIQGLQAHMRGQVGLFKDKKYRMKNLGSHSIITNTETGKSLDVPGFALGEVIEALNELG